MEDYNDIKPVTVQIEITDACNMRCPMCITSEQRKDITRSVLPPEFILEHILKPLKKKDVQSLSISGGEPTLSPHLLRVIKDARRLDYGIFLATNALSEKLHSYDSILKEIETGKSAIQMSFDSMYEEEFNAIRGGNFYTPVVQNIKKLKDLQKRHEYSTILVISLVVQENNAESFMKTIDFILSSLRINRIIVQLRHDYKEVTTGNWRKQKPLSLAPKALKSVLKNGEALFELSKKDNRISVMGRNIDNWEALLTSPTKIEQKCGSGRRIFVDPYGNLRGCIHSPIIANLYETDIEGYLVSDSYKAFLSFAEKCNICVHGCSS